MKQPYRGQFPPDYWDWGHWIKYLLAREPGMVIGGLDNPYMLRYYLVPRNPYLNVYLHKFLRSDDDRALHDHPWWFLSVMLKGGYWEHRKGKAKWRESPSVAIRKADTAHRVELDYEYIYDDYHRNLGSREKPYWTLIFTGPKIREWGFYCPQGWRHWHEFVLKNGCGE